MASVHPEQDSSTAARLALLGARPLLRGVAGPVLAEIAAALEPVTVRSGALVVQRGQTGVPLMLVVRGGLRASFVDEDRKRHVLFEYFRGATVGEALVLSGRPSPLDLHAIRDSELLCLSRERFDGLASRHPELTLGFARGITTRLIDLLGSPDVLASFSRKTDRLPRSVALLSVGGDEVGRTRSLVIEALARARSTIRLDAGEASQAMGTGGGGGANVTLAGLMKWFDTLDVRPELVVFECDRTEGPWLDFCLRQADRILVLLDEGECSASGQLADWWLDAKAGERPGRFELAIVHGRSDAPSHTGGFYAQAPGVARLHHVRGSDPRDAERLTRWLLNRPVGLVLSGGGARGIAHVGIIKALEEARIPVDIVGGASMGAIFAGGLARGWSADRMMEEVRRLFSTRWALYDPTLPRTALLAGKKLERVLKRYFGDLAIPDLWIQFFCVATNLSRARPLVHEMGRVRDAIRSSCSIPGLFPPSMLTEQVLVDGGIVDNLPVDVMGERCAGPIIAADVSNSCPEDEWGARSEKPLRLFEILTRATFLGSVHTTEMSLSSHPPALLLRPRLDEFRMLDWRAYEGIFQAGYACAKREIDAGALPRNLWEGRVVDAAV